MPKYHFYKQYDRSDCGATCLRMVCRYYGMMKLQLGSHVPTRGEILQDGHRLQEYRLTEWRECCGVAMSDGYIFSDTIANNIVLGRDEGDRNNMDAACETACIKLVQRYSFHQLGCHSSVLSLGSRRGDTFVFCACSVILSKKLLIYGVDKVEGNGNLLLFLQIYESLDDAIKRNEPMTINWRQKESRWQRFLNNESLKRKIYDVIFESDTPAGKTFDVALMLFIVFSILLVVVESMQSIPAVLQPYLQVLEYMFTFFFTVEYLLRLYSSPNPKKYALSFFGIVDLLATLPFYMIWLFGPARYLLIIRTFRLIRVFRVFKLFNFLSEGNLLMRSLYYSGRKLVVFFLFVVIMVISLGTLMYMVEGQEADTAFVDIPTSIYWAVVTMTTVGYGDIAPVTGIGRFLSMLVMLLGYTVMAVPTGIVSAQMVHDYKKKPLRHCPNCEKSVDDEEALYCKYCGAELEIHYPDE